MTSKTNLFLFLAIATTLLASPLTSGNAFADDDKNKKSKDDKNDKNPFKALWDAITGLQAQIDAISLIPGPPGKDGTNGLDGKDGTNGLDGKDGTNGLDGGSCHVAQVDAQTLTIFCDDGSSATITAP